MGWENEVKDLYSCVKDLKLDQQKTTKRGQSTCRLERVTVYCCLKLIVGGRGRDGTQLFFFFADKQSKSSVIENYCQVFDINLSFSFMVIKRWRIWLPI